MLPARLAATLRRLAVRDAELAHLQAQGQTCRTCQRHLPASAFGMDTARRVGLRATCRACTGLPA
jgi:hypothetical protein